MKVDSVQPKVNLNFVETCQLRHPIPVLYVYVVGKQRQTQGIRVRRQFRAQPVVRKRLPRPGMQPVFYVTLEFVVSVVNRRKKAQVGKKAQKNRESRNFPPPGEFMRQFVQNSRSDSLPANNSSHISPFSVHSGVTDPEIWTSSTFSVP